MTTFHFQTHISSSGEVSPISDWTGGETDAKITVVLSETAEEIERRTVERRQVFDDPRGCLKDVKGKDFITKKQIRSNRLEDRYGEKTSEDRQSAAKRFMELWDGAMVGLPDMTMKEIREERRESRYEK